jgi:hypothetical protein
VTKKVVGVPVFFTPLHGINVAEDVPLNENTCKNTKIPAAI